ncbi:efflux RND transporter permease subunit [Thalassomonas haliotis]|uniref:Efflux RND transporter permease subunit n=1 Tax=Thalassomonas haliotis TaxID=485448 RepID=A0ABY7VEN1_9GAMM|nr:efflux RND transporter permease subunit [Thalassomonas haliotis]WDE11841.1 efflux RND transporter permease subunit [Thalassomonas haliotis]
MLAKWFKDPAYGIAVIFIIMITGILAFLKLPVSLLPDIERPTMKVTTHWYSASAEDIQKYLIEPQEQVLKGLPHLHQVIATAYRGRAEISLSFDFNTDMDRSFMNIQQRLSMLRSKPLDALPPKIERSGSSNTLIFMFAQNTNDNARDIDSYQKLLEAEVITRLQEVEGVSHAELSLASEDEIHLILDMDKLAELSIPLSQIIEIIKLNKDISAGLIGQGKRSYDLRYKGYKNKYELLNTPLRLDGGSMLLLGDVADIQQVRSRRQHFVIHNGFPAIGIHVFKSAEANLLTSLSNVFDIVDDVNNGVLKEHGLRIEKSFDPSVFVNRSISLVISNLVIGTLLTIFGLYWFLRRFTSTLLISLSIVTTLLITFMLLFVFNRNLNIISLAGIALSTGIILDASIIVFDSIGHQLRKGLGLLDAAVTGCKKVFRALLSSTITSVVVFLPLLLLNSFEGKIFSDLAFTITVCVSVSLVVSMLILPIILLMKPALFLSHTPVESPVLTKLSAWLMAIQGNVKNSIAVVFLTLVLAIVILVTLVPKVDLLPAVRRDAIDSLLIMSKGANLDVLEQEVGQKIARRIAPYLNKEKSPAIANYYVVVSADFTALGVRPVNKADTQALKSVIENEITVDLPGVKTITYQAGLFGALESARSISVNVITDNPESIFDKLALLKEKISLGLAGASVRILPKPAQDVPRISILPDQAKINQFHVPESDVSALVAMAADGLYLGQFPHENEMLNLQLKAKDVHDLSSLMNQALLSENNDVISFSELVDTRTDVTISELRKINFQSGSTLTVSIPDDMAMDTASQILSDIVAQFNQEELLGLATASLSGASDTLNEAVDNLLLQFAFALSVLLLLMLLTFRSLSYALLTVLTLPFATLGGFIGLAVMGLFYNVSLDLLTLIGFVILMGLVINNTILFIDSYKESQSSQLNFHASLHQAFASRFRPIAMSTLTSILGMLPLAVMPGEGSELYRGLGVVIVSGMLFGSLLLLILVPAILNILHHVKAKKTLPISALETI